MLGYRSVGGVHIRVLRSKLGGSTRVGATSIGSVFSTEVTSGVLRSTRKNCRDLREIKQKT